MRLKIRFPLHRKQVLLIGIMVLTFLSFSLSINAQGTKWKKLHRNWVEHDTMWDVSYRSGNYIAVGDNGQTWTSSDGFNWKTGGKTQYACYGVAWGSSRIVAVGGKGQLYTSSNGGTSWATKKLITPQFWDVDYDPDRNWFVASGSEGWVCVSKDGGSSWTSKKLAGASSLTRVGFGNGKFLISSTNGTVYVSSDAVTWTAKNAGSENLFGIAYGNRNGQHTYVVAGRYGAIYVTSDPNLNTWSDRSHPEYGKIFLFRGEYTGSSFVLIGEYDSKRQPIVAPVFTSSDTVSWTYRDSKAYNAVLGMVYNPTAKRLLATGSYRTMVYSDADNLTIDVTNPYTGVNQQPTWQSGTTQNITWNPTGALGNLKLAYSISGFAGNFVTIADNVNPADGTYSWTIPDVTSENCIIRIGEMDGSPAVYSTPFTISGSSTLTVTAPNGGENLTPGGTYTIKWNSTAVSDSIRIRYSSNGGATWILITDTANTGSYKWAVPNISTSRGLVRINAVNGAGEPSDQSDANFSIGGSAPPTPDGTITISSPNGGEEWDVDSSQTITWTTTGTVGNVRVRYSTDNGTNWTKIGDNVPNSGSFNWTVPNTPSTTCLVRINEINASGEPYDQSNGVFTIGAGSGITVTSPNGGESLVGGSVHTVTWTSENAGSQVKLEYSTNSGGAWNSITTSTANDGSYDWQVPTTPSMSCLVRITDTSNSSLTDTSNSVFTITPDGSISLTAPNGGEKLTAGSAYDVTWSTTGTVGTIRIEYSTDSGSSWTGIVNATANDGRFGWPVPDVTSSTCMIRVSDTDYAGIYDRSNSVFSIGAGSVTLTSPNGGEKWAAGSVENITWTSEGSLGNVKLEYSSNGGGSWNSIINSTGNTGSYGWTLPGIVSDNYLVRVSAASGSSIVDVSDNVFSIGGTKTIALNKNTFQFGYNQGGSVPGAQTLIVSNSGYGTLNWTIADDAGWLIQTPSSGSGGAFVSLVIDPSGLAPGTYNATMTVTDPDAENSPTVAVSLKVKSASQAEKPLGVFEEPKDGAVVSSSVAVGGWTLDDSEVVAVKIYTGDYHIGDAVFVEGARDDIPGDYPDYPNNTRAGWGYLMLTNFLPGGGNGVYPITVKAFDNDGNATILGTHTITVNNVDAVKPFGALDTPSQGGNAEGKFFVNWGWALTPKPSTIPTDGSTIWVWVDGEPQGHPEYNIPRDDLAKRFPDYNNVSGPVGIFYLDTTKFDNGTYNISWSVKDNAGNTDGIGSRFFNIWNLDDGSSQQAASQQAGSIQADSDQAGSPQGNINPNTWSNRSTTLCPRLHFHRHTLAEVQTMPDHGNPVYVKTGYDVQGLHRSLQTDETGAVVIDVKLLERLEIQVSDTSQVIAGYMRSGDRLGPLPVGSTLNLEKGTFYWQTGPGFKGEYNLVFITKDADGSLVKSQVRVNISSKY